MNTLYAIRDKKTGKFIHKQVTERDRYDHDSGGFVSYWIYDYPQLSDYPPNLNYLMGDWKFDFGNNQPDPEIVKLTYTIEPI